MFHAIVGTAFRLIENDGTFLLMREGDGYRAMSIARAGRPVAGPGDELIALDAQANFPSRVLLSGTVLHLPDWLAIELPPHEQRVQAGDGIRSSLMLPIMQGDECIGVLGVARREPGEFSDKHIALLRAFVDQAVIAIKNVRLFNETQEALAPPDRHRRDPAGHQQLADRRAAGVRGHRRQRPTPVELHARHGAAHRRTDLPAGGCAEGRRLAHAHGGTRCARSTRTTTSPPG